SLAMRSPFGENGGPNAGSCRGLGKERERIDEFGPRSPSHNRARPRTGLVQSSRWFNRVHERTSVRLHRTIPSRNTGVGMESGHSSGRFGGFDKKMGCAPEPSQTRATRSEIAEF